MAEAFHDTLIDYINWRGDLSFRADPFNEVDNVVLSELVYLDLSKVLKPMLKNGPFVRDVYDAIEKKNCYRLLTVTGGHEDFIKAAASSNRFGKIRVTNYKDVFELDLVGKEGGAVTRNRSYFGRKDSDLLSLAREQTKLKKCASTQKEQAQT